MLISSSDLAHFGVKGMKWGVRNAHPKFTQDRQDEARDRFGKRGARRINKRIHKGKTVEGAFKSERRRQIAKRIALTLWASMILKNLAVQYGSVPLHSAMASKWASNGAKEAADILASRGITNYQTINLAMNSATGIWE